MNKLLGRAQLIVATGLLAACGSTGPLAVTSIPPGAPRPTEQLSGGVPQQLTDLELIASGAGEASYTGYSCWLIAPAGCACETPVIQKARFTFTADNRLMYDSQPLDGAPNQLQLEHAGVNLWSYATSLRDPSGDTQVLVLALLSFSSDGYFLTQVATMNSGEIVACPDVIFRRLP